MIKPREWFYGYSKERLLDISLDFFHPVNRLERLSLHMILLTAGRRVSAGSRIFHYKFVRKTLKPPMAYLSLGG
jgi:hypothetical protein